MKPTPGYPKPVQIFFAKGSQALEGLT